MTIAQKIKLLRKENRWSQAEVAKFLDVHITHVSRIETGRYTPSLELLKKIAKLFEVSTDYLLFDDIDNNDSMDNENQDLFKKIQQLNSLEKKDQEVIIGVIDAFLTKKRIRQIIN